MKDKKLNHLDEGGNPQMADVTGKPISLRTARAEGRVRLPDVVVALLKDQEIFTAKGPVFQTAILAGTMAAKNTGTIIPLAHPLPLTGCKINISLRENVVIIESTVTVHARTGVEMEALTAVAVAALTIYDMCKAFSHDILIENIRLMEKTGGKHHFKRTEQK